MLSDGDIDALFPNAEEVPGELNIEDMDDDSDNPVLDREMFVHWLQEGYTTCDVARTLLHDPEVLIFDEPANGLDPEARIEMRDLLLRLAELGKTLIVTSHILPELSRICDEIAIISGGKLRASGTMAEINEQLGQMRMVEIHLHGAERIDEAQDIVRGHSDIAEIAGSKTEELIRFRANLTDQGMAQLLNSLVTANIPIAQFHEVQTDLEDAFLTVTKEDRAKMV